MPRKSRIDAPGALQHIIARGIDGERIFRNNADREHFLNRLGDILKETNTACYAWALIPNHFHLLLRTADVSISTVMRRLMTGYAMWFNRRHQRYGHLFQNRYKSILCQENLYFLELVRYIHLNPFRAGLVEDLNALDSFLYSGHSAVMGKSNLDWQHVDTVLGLFGKTAGVARKAYRVFLEKGIKQGKRNDLTGGGLIRSVGGWAELKTLRASRIFEKGDERILGNSDFVDSVIKTANETKERKYELQARGYDLSMVAARVAEVLGVDQETVWAEGKRREIVQARSLLCYWAVREMGMTMTSLSLRLALSVTAIGKAVVRGEKLARENQYLLIEK